MILQPVILSYFVLFIYFLFFFRENDQVPGSVGSASPVHNVTTGGTVEMFDEPVEEQVSCGSESSTNSVSWLLCSDTWLRVSQPITNILKL